MRLFYFICIFWLILGWTACNNDDDDGATPVPSLQLVGLNKTTVLQGNVDAANDTLAITFRVTDQSGDFGVISFANNVFLFDNRNETVYQFFVVSNNTGAPQIEEEFTVNLINRPFQICCLYDDDTDDCQPNPDVPTNTVTYTLQVRDFAGNVSNAVETDPVTILCE